MQAPQLGCSLPIPIFENYSKIISFPTPDKTEEGSCRLVTNEFKPLKHTGDYIVVPYLPGYKYVLLPGSNEDQGSVSYFAVAPPLIFNFSYNAEIYLQQVQIF